MRNFFLLIVSLVFYAWGEGALVLVMIASTMINYFAGLGISGFAHRPKVSKAILAIGICINLLLLVYYKYLGFIVSNLPFEIPELAFSKTMALPIGISFYTFHGLSYLVDIYRKGLPGQKNPFDLGLYIAFFPQLVAGPIVRYSDIESQIRARQETSQMFFEGIIRFIQGFAKKILVANTAALIADRAFQQSSDGISISAAWIGAIAYMLQIYFDFSGYSDMAIGLAKMFGFTFKENFNYPYTAISTQDFWRRWHISLSTWFRDYLYIPLGGNQKGPFRTYLNLFIVFFVTGLWHGASWNFVVWGLFHGLFLILERSEIIRTEKFPSVLKHVYVILVVLVGWVLFRADNLSHAIQYLGNMVGTGSRKNDVAFVMLNNYSIFLLLAGVFFSMHVKFPKRLSSHRDGGLVQQSSFRLIGIVVIHMLLFMFAILELAQANYNPFIYFRF
ncbi:MBOAT family O-acyltransferase [Pseudochryseolinea flava]|uniref:MBOAT family O-acyltransferase n=1 Tax=Pseudochryseolinea flava TaxID=2059302 RepID=UPI001FEC4FBA|nr:MBOAT family O-acyltransferase [Pseudochryseolinea flava]